MITNRFARIVFCVALIMGECGCRSAAPVNVPVNVPVANGYAPAAQTPPPMVPDYAIQAFPTSAADAPAPVGSTPVTPDAPFAVIASTTNELQPPIGNGTARLELPETLTLPPAANVTQVSSVADTKSDFVAPAAPQPAAQPAVTPQLEISGVAVGGGDILVAVFTSGDNFPSSDSAAQTLRLAPAQATLVVDLNVSGDVAVAVFQDSDGNGVITRGKFGIPLEPFAFSNDAQAQRKPPSFAAAVVTLSPASPRTSIRLGNLR